MRSLLLVVLALLGAGCGASEPDVSGTWDGRSSEWGKVVIDGLQGTYTDTYGPPPGKIALEKTGPRSYRGTWKETDEHGGTLTFVLSEDGRGAEGTYTTWDSSPRRPGYNGKVVWRRP